jgi:plastocyanin
MRLRRAKLVALGGAGLLWAFGWLWIGTVALAQDAESKTAKIVDFNFDPGELKVAVGTKITWTNTGQRPHTVTDRGGTFDTRPISPGKTGAITFSVPGRYAYFCRINPAKMNGVVEVTAGAEASRVNRIQAIDPAREGEKLRFDPPELEVQAGSTLVVANIGGKPHTLTADDGSFDTGTITPGAEGGRFAGTSATLTLPKAGTFPFHCEVHPAAMKGVLTVTGEAAAGGGGAAAGSTAPNQASVSMQDLKFVEPEVSVAPGGEVTWKNDGKAAHTATFDDVELNTGTVQPGTEAKLTAPEKPGSYSYRCTVHPAAMRAVLVVPGANTPDPTEEAAPAAPAAATGGGGDGENRSALSYLALVTGAVGAFLAGFGVSAFARRRSE